MTDHNEAVPAFESSENGTADDHLLPAGLPQSPPLLIQLCDLSSQTSARPGEESCWYPSEVADLTICIELPGEAADEPLSDGSNWRAALARRIRNSTEVIGQLPQSFFGPVIPIEGECVIEERVKLKFGNRKAVEARSLITFSNAHRFVSGTFRLLGDDKTPEHTVLPFGDWSLPLPENQHARGMWRREFRVRDATPLQIRSIKKGEVKINGAKFAFSPDAAADLYLEHCGLLKLAGTLESPKLDWTDGRKNPLLRPVAKDVESHASGLVVIAGATGTGKSTVATSFCLRYLLHVADRNRTKENNNLLVDFAPKAPPHLITFEDPIESWELRFGISKENSKRNFATGQAVDLLGSESAAAECGFWLTARQKGLDVRSLRDARLHALRQKPSVVYIGEVRDDDDWKDAISLSKTGHLVVTTCHASSLVETFSKLDGGSEMTAEGRRSLADALLAVIHLKNLPVTKLPTPATGDSLKLSESQTYTTMWRNTSESVSNFVADGLSSLIPDGDNIFSRRALATSLLNRQSEKPYSHLRRGSCTAAEWELVRQRLISAATEDDRSAG